MRCQGDLVPNNTGTMCVCPAGKTLVTPNGNTCQGRCDDDQIFDGTACQECGAGQEANADNSMCEACPDNMVSDGDGDCLSCNAATGVPNTAKTQCIFTCDDGTTRTGEQACEEECTMANEDYNAGTKTCTACTGNDHFNNGACEECQENSSPSPDRGECLCDDGHALINGTCSICGDGTGVSEERTSCQQCAPGMFSNDDGICRPCPAGEGPNNARTACVTQNQCDDRTTARPSFNEVCEEDCLRISKNYDPATKSCIDCPNDNEVFNGTICVACLGPKIPNIERNFCVCPAGQTNYPIINPTPTEEPEMCSTLTLPEYPPETADVYNDDSCRSQGWSVVYDFDSGIAELCEIRVRVRVVDNSSTSASALSETAVDSPLQSQTQSMDASCLMRADDGYAGDFPSCLELFGDPPTRAALDLSGGFPDALEDSSFQRLPGGGLAIDNPPPDVDSADSSDMSTIIFGGVAAVVLYSWLLSDGGVESLSLQPQAEVRHNDSGSYYAYGSRLGFAANNWSGYWETLQTRSGGRTGDWIYGAGTEWTGDVFSASLENTTQGYDSDTAFSVSAKKQWGNWTLESSYVSDLRIRDVLNTTWRNRLGVGANAVYNQWTLTPRVEFSWQDSELNDDEVRFRMNVLREF